MLEPNPNQRIHTRDSGFIPETFFYLTISLSICVMVIMDTVGLSTISIPRSSFFDRLTFIIDPFAVQIAVAIMVSMVISLFTLRILSKNPESKTIMNSNAGSGLLFRLFNNKTIRVIFSLGIGFICVASLMILEYILEKWVFKPSFFVPRPIVALSEPPFTAIIQGFLGVNPYGISDGAPSGFVLRQLWLFMTCIVFCEKLFSNINDDISRRWTKGIIYGFILLSVLFVAFSRVYRGQHALSDVGIAIGLGTFFFWYALTVVTAILFKSTKFLTELGGSTFAFTFLFFFYSQSSFWWVLLALLAFLILAIAYLFSSRPSTYRGRFHHLGTKDN